MKSICLFILLLIGQYSIAQTKDLQKVSGTKCSLIPPLGFVASSTFSGFQDNESGSSIMINEIPASYQTIVDGFTADALKVRGMTLISKQNVNLNNLTATFVEVKQPANGITYLKQLLIFGDAKHTVLVNGIYPEAAKAMAPKIKAALFSTVYDPSQNENPLAAVPFTIDVDQTNLKLVKYISGSLLYSVDGKIPTETPTLIVGNSIAKVPATDQKRYAEERLKKLPGGDKSIIKATTEITIGNLKGYEIVANGFAKNNVPELMYQVMLFNDKGDYYIIVGQTKENFDQQLTVFKKVARTFKLK